MTPRQLYGSWIMMMHAARAHAGAAKTDKEARKHNLRASTLSECARALRATLGLDLPEPQDCAPRTMSESAEQYETRIGWR